MSDLPPYLRAKATAKAAQIRQSLATQLPSSPAQPANGEPTGDRTGQQPLTASESNEIKPNLASEAGKKPKSAGKRGKGGGGNPSGQRVAGQTDYEALADAIVAQSGDQEAAGLARPHLPAVLEALCKGAAVPGSTGAADRAMLLRLIKHSSSTAREQATAARSVHVHVGARLVGAAARRTAASRGRMIEGRAETVEIGPIGRASVTVSGQDGGNA